MSSFEFQHVRRRITTIRQIRKVTSALQRVSAARLVSDRRLLDHARRYGQRLREVLRDVLGSVDEPFSPLLRPGPPGQPWRVVAMGAERGLCGGYHATLGEAFDRFRSNVAPLQAVVIGRILLRRIRRSGVPVIEALPQPPRDGRGDTVERLSGMIIAAFTEGSVSGVSLLYMHFKSPQRRTAVVERLLPVSLERASTLGLCAFEPDGSALLQQLLPEYVRQRLDEALLNSFAAEDAARQEAMSRATENAGDMLGDLMARYRRLRQDKITDEMLELVAGSLGREGRD